MQISALVDIVEGRLINTPAISFITQIHTDIKKVNEGDGFFANNQSEITLALQKGAFAIIYEKEQPITDKEIAWIKVDDLKKSIANILRYKLISFENQYICTNKIFLYLLNIFKTKELKSIVLLDTDNISKNFEKLSNIEQNKVIFSTDKSFLENITTDIFFLEDSKFNIKNLTIHSLFETSFSYKNHYFDKLKIPRVYVDYLLQVLELFEYKLDLKKLSNFNLFHPLFINKSDQITPFGQTNRFILSSNDQEIIKLEKEFIQTHYNYGKTLFIDAQNLSEQEILKSIQTNHYNLLYFENYKIDSIVNILNDNDNQGKLL
jgi:hypothetical protein